jgi:hypothetical protein
LRARPTTPVSRRCAVARVIDFPNRACASAALDRYYPPAAIVGWHGPLDISLCLECAQLLHRVSGAKSKDAAGGLNRPLIVVRAHQHPRCRRGHTADDISL